MQGTYKAIRPPLSPSNLSEGNGFMSQIHPMHTDYETYREIMGELLRPISGDGLDADTLKRLYESKLVYLENLRVKCFREINMIENSPFTGSDYDLILQSIAQTRTHLRHVMLAGISINLRKREAS